jgi:hypothetical protein
MFTLCSFQRFTLCSFQRFTLIGLNPRVRAGKSPFVDMEAGEAGPWQPGSQRWTQLLAWDKFDYMKFALNTLIAALIIATVAEVGKRSPFLGALLVSLPVTSLLALSFLYVETKDVVKVSALSTGIFWLVLPSLVFFLLLPFLLRSGWSFWLSLASASTALIAFYACYSWLLAKAGIEI